MMVSSYLDFFPPFFCHLHYSLPTPFLSFLCFVLFSYRVAGETHPALILNSRKIRAFLSAGSFLLFLGKGRGWFTVKSPSTAIQTAQVKISHTGLSGDVRVALGVHGLMCIMVSSRPYMDGLYSVELLSLRVIVGPLLCYPRESVRASSRRPFLRTFH